MKYQLSAVLLVALSVVAACHPHGGFVRDTDVLGLDDPAMSTSIDRNDLDRVFFETVADLFTSRFYAETRGHAGRPPIAIAPIVNRTSEHLGNQLDTLLARFEESLVAAGAFTVVTIERRAPLIHETLTQQSEHFDRRVAAEIGRRYGAAFVVTGKVHDIVERDANLRRVQYAFAMQVMNVETGEVTWMRSSELTKAYIGRR